MRRTGSPDTETKAQMLDILVDADACPVKQEVYRVAERHRLRVILVSNSSMFRPQKDWIELVVVGTHLDAADDWIAEHAGLDDIVISGDVPLAARCLERGALVLGPAGHAFTQDNIGEALATRDLLFHLREIGTMTGGPAPFQKKDRSRFLQRLDEMIHAVRRSKS